MRKRRRRDDSLSPSKGAAQKRHIRHAGDEVVNRTGAGRHGSKKGKKGCGRHPKHKGGHDVH